MGLIQMAIVILLIITVLYVFSFWASTSNKDEEKLSTYETGFTPKGDARKKIDIVYWIKGLLYLIFD